MEPFTRRFLAVALTANLAVVAVYAATQLTWRYRGLVPNPIRAMLRTTSEDSVITWTSVVAMFGVGALCLVLGGLRRSWRWRLAGAFFLYLSLDDEAMIHERLGWFAGPRGTAVFHWVVAIMPLIALGGVLTFVHLWRETRGARSLRVRVLLAYAMWFGALALEVPEKFLTENGVEWRGVGAQHYTKLVEETLEVVAPLLVLSCLMDLAAHLFREGWTRREHAEGAVVRETAWTRRRAG